MESELHAEIAGCRLIDLETHCDPRGNLTVAQGGNGFPFDIRRVFYIHDIPAGSERGGHAHFEMNELIIAASGCFDVEVTDGSSSRTYTLRNPSQALFLPAGIWRSLSNFSAGAVCLTLCDTLYDEADYIREYPRYISLINQDPESK